MDLAQPQNENHDLEKMKTRVDDLKLTAKKKQEALEAAQLV